MSIILLGRRRAKTTRKEIREGIAGPRFSWEEWHFTTPWKDSRTDLRVVILCTAQDEHWIPAKSEHVWGGGAVSVHQSLGMFIDFAKAVANHRDRNALRDPKAAKESVNCPFLFTTPFY